MEVLIEKIAIYSLVGIFILIIVLIYLRKLKRESNIVREKIRISKEEGLHEPVSLHPVVDPNTCIKTGACITACPEKDILGILDGRATIINASRCIGHGACFHACPVEAITLCIGTEKRGVDLPHVNQYFETNVPGIFIAGELGGMGLIKNAVEQGKQAVENLAKTLDRNSKADYDLVIVGAGPAGISASLTAKKLKIKAVILEQDSLGGTVYTFPRSKIVMTSPMDLPLHGKVKLYETSKSQLLDLWNEVIEKNQIELLENTKVESIHSETGVFRIQSNSGGEITTKKVLLAIGRRGTPRKLNIPGEMREKVAYRLIEPELIHDKKVVVVGGGDSAIEAALSICEDNQVQLVYRGAAFNRIKPKNKKKIDSASDKGSIMIKYNSNLTSINENSVHILEDNSESAIEYDNDLVYIFAGGELPTNFLAKTGITITKKFGEAILSHKN
jgi:thioredoxin reductase (NADPH)